MMDQVFLANPLTLPLRPRRNRKSPAIRSLVQETHLFPQNLIAPLFLIDGDNQKIPIPSLPEIERLTLDFALQEAKELHAKGIQAIALFPVLCPSKRSFFAQEAWNEEGLMCTAIRMFKEKIPSLCIIVDVALDPYTLHGHDGLVDSKGNILNDETVDCLLKMALAFAKAGVDMIAPSDMMDGRIGALRKGLDEKGYTDVSILSYCAKYASALYGPFRQAMNTRLSFGDKKSYQMDPANAREAVLEALLDQKEGADILMVKPATFYLDVIVKIKERTDRPIAAYHVSGEYAMVMAAHEKGWLDAPSTFYEALLSIKRAGADLIFSYASKMILKYIARM